MGRKAVGMKTVGVKSFGTAVLAATVVMAAGFLHPAFADLMNFYNGHTVTGKLTYVAGDLIYYTTGVGKEGSAKRLNLTNRQDVVETWAGHKYIGEVVFVDNMWVELTTPIGQQRVKRLWVKNIVLGSPRVLGPAEMIETPGQMLGGARTITNTTSGYHYCPSCDANTGVPAFGTSPLLPSQNGPSQNPPSSDADESGKPMVRIPAESGLQ